MKRYRIESSLGRVALIDNALPHRKGRKKLGAREDRCVENIYTLEVEGYLWSGGHGTYEYAVDKDFELTFDNANRRAGDFETLTKATLVKTIRKIQKTTTVEELEL